MSNGENYPRLERLVLRRLRKQLKKEGEQYNDDCIIEAVHEAIYEFHEAEINAYFNFTKKGTSNLCSACGKCCKNCQIVMTEGDVQRLSTRINPLDYIIPDTLRAGRYVFKDVPCKFHQNDNRCGLYHVRPQSCRNYPLIAPDGRERMVRSPDCMFVVRFFVLKAHALLKQRF